jgi:hypothetical protein
MLSGKLNAKFYPPAIYKNSTQPEIRVNRVRDNESQLYMLTCNNTNSYRLSHKPNKINVVELMFLNQNYFHSLSQIYLSKYVYYLGIKIGSQVKHPVIDFDIFTLCYFTCLF